MNLKVLFIFLAYYAIIILLFALGGSVFADSDFNSTVDFDLITGTNICYGHVDKNLFGSFYCTQFNQQDANGINHVTEAECNSINGCTYEPPYTIFNITVYQASCTGEINLTSLGLSEDSDEDTLCPQIENRTLCRFIGCDWITNFQSEDLPKGGLFDSGVSFGRFIGIVTFGVGLPEDTPTWFSLLFILWQTIVTIFFIGFIISSIWNG